MNMLLSIICFLKDLYFTILFLSPPFFQFIYVAKCWTKIYHARVIRDIYHQTIYDIYFDTKTHLLLTLYDDSLENIDL